MPRRKQNQNLMDPLIWESVGWFHLPRKAIQRKGEQLFIPIPASIGLICSSYTIYNGGISTKNTGQFTFPSKTRISGCARSPQLEKVLSKLHVCPQGWKWTNQSISDQLCNSMLPGAMVRRWIKGSVHRHLGLLFLRISNNIRASIIWTRTHQHFLDA